VSLTTYTIISIPVIVAFIAANHYYGLPWWGSLGLAFSLMLCVKGLF
jgi:hypothetical protein